MSILAKAKGIRTEAWATLMGSPDFATFKASDDFVVALGGESIMPAALAEAAKGNGSGSAVLKQIQENPTRRLEVVAEKRITQADAAEAALREKGEPLAVGRFMEAAVAKGARFTGKDELANFRSAVSKDKRFYSFSRNNMHFWWFEGEPLPPGWNETAGPDLLAGPAESSVTSN